MSKDAAETNDLAETHGDKVRELAQKWERMAKEIHEVAKLETVE